MFRIKMARRQDYLLSVVAYVTWAAVAVAGLAVVLEGQARWWGAVLLVAFGLGMTQLMREEISIRAAHLYLAFQTAMVAGLMALHPGWSIFPILFFLLSAQVMLLLPQRQALAWIGVFTLVTGSSLVAMAGWRSGLLTLPIYGGGFLFFGVFAQALGQAEVARQESQALLDELQEAHRQLQEYAARIEELAVAEERNRLAREMHDTLGHRLTVASVQLEGAERLIPTDPERAAQMVGTVREQVRTALGELRHIVAALRTPLEADLPLAKVLARLADDFEKATDITVHRSLPPTLPPLSPALHLTLYRTAQEALTNVQRHANARRVWLSLQVQEDMVTLDVRDDGRGLTTAAEPRGFGLRGLRERAHQLGGELHLHAAPEGGCRLTLHVPLAPPLEERPPNRKACQQERADHG